MLFSLPKLPGKAAGTANDTTKIAAKLETCIEKHFGRKIMVTVRSLKQMKAINAKIPKNWTNDGEMRTDIIFLWEEVDSRKVLSEIKTNPDVDNLLYTKGAVIWNFDRKNYTKSRMNKFIGKYVYKNMTARNVNTLRKLLELMNA